MDETCRDDGSFASAKSRIPWVHIATDRPAALAAMASLMRERRWSVELTPFKTFSLASSRLPDVVVVDQGSHPAYQAFERARHLRASFTGPILVLTSLGVPSVTAQARGAGCTCVTTPCRAQHVVDCVYSALAMADRRWTRERGSASRTIKTVPRSEPAGELEPTAPRLTRDAAE